jgi:oligopeptide transport system permease protein
MSPVAAVHFRYMGQIVMLDFGPSYQYKDWTVNQLIARGFPVSLAIGGTAMLLAFVVGTLIGVIAALRQNSAVDYSIMGIAMMGISIPNFVVAPLLILFLAVYAGWLPAGGWEWSFRHMLLPVITLALPVIAYIARLTRGSMIEVLHSNYIRTARAKGLPERIVLGRHAMRPALLPVISYMGPATAGLITGSVVIEPSTPSGPGQLFRAGCVEPRLIPSGHGRGYFLRRDHRPDELHRFDMLYAWLNPKIRFDELSDGTHESGR